MHPHERLSALMDDAGDPSDQQFLLDSLAQSDLRETWSRYHLIGESLRDPNSSTLGTDLPAKISQALAAEPPPNALAIPLPSKHATSALRKPLFSAALAASVAALALLGLNSSVDSITSPTTIADTTAPLALNEPPATQVSELSNGEYQRRLKAYLINFNEQRAQLQAPIADPHVRVIDFDASPRQ
ncbi:MAG: hypothetical protein EXR86_07745 [Gammaproteobacteria bacterium]|nr:hypothetical protein [Gammaproteobacteria bacterium]